MKSVFRIVSKVSAAAMLIIVMIPSASISQTKSDLHEAVSQGDEASITKLLDGGGDVNARNEMGMTLLMGAASTGNIKIISLLLSKGADINAKSDVEGLKGFTALMFAVSGGHAEAVNVLIKKGADVNAKYEDRWSALTVASAAGMHEIVDILIKNGADKTNLKKNIAQFKEYNRKQVAEAHLRSLTVELKSVYLSAKAYLIDHPGSTITKLSQLDETGFKIGTDDILFVKANISETSGSVVFRSKRLDASNSIAAKGLHVGEGMVNFEGELLLPKLK